MSKICFTCNLLGECGVTNLEMLKNEQGCGSWEKATDVLIKARKRAKALAGPFSLKAMLIKDPTILKPFGR